MLEQKGSGPGGAIMEQPGAAGAKTTIDVHSRDAFELLKLGEAICHIQADQRSLRLEKEELRFERERYKNSAAQLQAKLTAALAELGEARLNREENDALRREVVAVAEEFKNKLQRERSNAALVAQEFEQRLQGERRRADAAERRSQEETDRLRGDIEQQCESRYAERLGAAHGRIEELQQELEQIKQSAAGRPSRWKSF